MDVFANSAFSVRSLAGAIDRIAYAPQMLGAMGVFERRAVTRGSIYIDRRQRDLTLIPASPRGAAPFQLGPEIRDAVPVRTQRLAKASTIMATEIADVRAFNRENEVEVMQSVVADRLARLRRDMELTHEHHRLGAVQGVVVDADGVTVLDDWFDLFGVTKPAPINFALSNSGTSVRQIAVDLARTMARTQGAVPPGATIAALCGDDFYDGLVGHPSVEKFYLNRPGRDMAEEGRAFDTFRFGNVTWINYRGTDDASQVAIPTNEARFFPIGAPGVFQHIMAPDDEYVDGVGTLGRDIYARQYPDHHDPAMRRAQVVQMDSYPAFVCTRPEVLQSGVAS